jgi:hypothetical protein
MTQKTQEKGLIGFDALGASAKVACVSLGAVALSLMPHEGRTQSATEAQSFANKMQISMADGELREIYGTRYRASGPTQALAVLSSEFATLAVVEGRLSVDELSAKPGQALVTPITSRTTQRFAFDAMRLSATLRPEWIASVGPQLNALVKAQKRRRFWGLLEPTGVNATSPVPNVIENVRQSYLSQPAIVQLRRQSLGNQTTLTGLTAQKFVDAVKGRDVDTIAALIDPYPFTDAKDEAAAWQAARRAFAGRLLEDAPLVDAISTGALEDGTLELGQYRLRPSSGSGGFIIHMVARDGAAFIASVEPLS